MKKMTKTARKKRNKRILCISIIGLIISIVIIFSIIKVNKSKPQQDITEEEKFTLYDTKISDNVKETENGVKINVSNKLNTDKILEEYTISNIQLTSQSGTTTLLADVINNSETEQPLTTITATLIDEKGEKICDVKGIVKALNPKGIGKLSISMSGNFVDAHDVTFSK